MLTDSRYWRYGDIRSFSQSERFHFEITSIHRSFAVMTGSRNPAMRRRRQVRARRQSHEKGCEDNEKSNFSVDEINESISVGYHPVRKLDAV